MGDVIQDKALNSRDRLEQLRGSFHFEHIFAKINPIEPQQPPPPQESIVFVITRSSLPPIPSSIYDVIGYRNYTVDLTLHLSSRQNTQHPQSFINMCDLIKEGLIYSGNDPITGENAYWYKVQDNDILSSYNASYNDDVARGYIVLLNHDEMTTHSFNRIETLKSCPSKGGKSSLLQRKKRKNITKKRRRVSRRKPRISRRKH